MAKKQYSLKQRAQWAKEDYGLDYIPSPVEVGLAMTKERVTGKRQPWQQVGSGAQMAAELARDNAKYRAMKKQQEPGKAPAVSHGKNQGAAPFQLPQNARAMEFAAADMNQMLPLPVLQGNFGEPAIKWFPTAQEAQNLARQAAQSLKENTQWGAPPVIDHFKQDMNHEGRALVEKAQSVFQRPIETAWAVSNQIADAMENVGDAIADPQRRKNLANGKFWGENTMAGLSNINKTTAQFADMLAPDIITPKPVQNILDWYQNDGAGWERKAAETSEALGLKPLGDLTQSAAKNIPNVALALLGGGSAASTGNIGAKSGIMGAAENLVKNPMFLTSFVQAAGNSYADAKEEGASELQAQAMAFLNGTANAAIEVGGGIEGINTAPPGWRGLLQTAYEEGSEEVKQGIIENLLAKGLYRQDAPWFSLENNNAVVDPLRMSAEFGGGALLGGVMGAGGQAFNKGMNWLNERSTSGRMTTNTSSDMDMVPLPLPQVQGETTAEMKNASTQETTVRQAINTPENLTRFAQEVDGVFNGSRSPAQAVAIGKTPAIYEQFGAQPLTMTINPNTMYKIAYPEGYLEGKHNLGIPALKQLPQQLQNPVAILKSKSQPNSLVILTEWADTQGDPVIIPLHLDKRGAVSLENMVVSAYGKQGIESILGKNGENVLWTKGNEGIDQILSIRLQLPQAVDDDTLVSNYNIPQNGKNVNGAGNNMVPLPLIQAVDNQAAAVDNQSKGGGEYGNGNSAHHAGRDDQVRVYPDGRRTGESAGSGRREGSGDVGTPAQRERRILRADERSGRRLEADTVPESAYDAPHQQLRQQAERDGMRIYFTQGNPTVYDGEKVFQAPGHALSDVESGSILAAYGTDPAKYYEHEMYHINRERNPELARKAERLISLSLDQTGSLFERYEKHLKEGYAKNGVTIEFEDVLEELAANISNDYLNTGTVSEKYARYFENGKVPEKVLQALKTLREQAFGRTYGDDMQREMGYPEREITGGERGTNGIESRENTGTAGRGLRGSRTDGRRPERGAGTLLEGAPAAERGNPYRDDSQVGGVGAGRAVGVKDSLNVPYQLPTGESVRQYSGRRYDLPILDAEARRQALDIANQLNPAGRPQAATTEQATATTSKAQRVQNRRENSFVDKVGEALSVPKGARREYLKPLAQQMAAEVKQTGHVAPETANAAFEAAYSQGIVVMDEYYNQYKSLKDELRQTTVTLDAASRASREYNDLRTRYFGSLKLAAEGGTPVDVKYQELAQAYPELFDAELSAPLDQLARMGEVAKSIQKTGVELDAYYGDDAAEFKRFARNGFDEAVARLEEDIGRVKRYEADVAREQEEKAAAAVPQPIDAAQVKEAYRTARELQRGAEKIVAQELLTREDKAVVDKLLRGDLAPEDVKGDNRGAILRVAKAKEAAQKALEPVRAYNAQRKAALAAEAARDVAASDGWKDKMMGLQYSTETMERNLRDIIPDRAEARAISDKYFRPVHEHEAAATRFKNEMRAKVKALGLTPEESVYLQIYGELAGRTAAQEMGETRSDAEVEHLHKAELEYLAEHPNVDKAKIEDALKVFRDTYDQIFEQMNDANIKNGYAPIAYRKGYFPHFTETKPDSVLGRLAARLGINVEKDTLPTDIAGLTYTFRPGRRWNPFAKQRTGFGTTYDALKGFDKYIEVAADVIYHTEDIQRLRALEDAIRSKNSEAGVRQAAEDIRNNEGLTDEQKSTLLTELYSKEKGHLNHFVQELNEYTNLLAGKKSIHDRSIEINTGRSVYQLMSSLESRVAANMVAVNPGSWLTNFIPLTQASAECSTGSMIRAAKETARAYFKDDGFADTSTFLTNRRGSEPLSRTTLQKISEKLTKPMFYIDDFTSNVVTRAKYYDNLKAGMDAESAMKNADSFAANIIADRSKGAQPTIFEHRNPLTKLLTMYQVEVNNQLRYLVKDLPDDLKEKGLAALVGALMKYTIGAYLFNDLYEMLVGRRPALDFLGLANDALGDYTGYALPNTFETMGKAARGEPVSVRTEKKSAVEATLTLGDNIAEELPFVGGLLGGGRIPMSSALPDGREVISNGIALVSGEKNKGKAMSNLGKELAKPAYYLLPPLGGGQIKKAVEGLSTVAKGGSYGLDSQGNEVLQFPVENKSLGTYAKGALFGKYALPGAQEYVDSGFKAKSAGYTAAYKEALAGGMTGEDFRKTWKALDANGDGRVTSGEAMVQLPLLDLTDDQRIMFWRQTATDSKKEKYEQAEKEGLGKEYVDLLLKADSNKNGSLSKAEIMAYLDEAILQSNAKRLLFELTSTAKNPY